MPRRRRRSFGLLDLFYLIVIGGLLVGGSLWLDRNGVVASARVEGKREHIVVIHEPAGRWDRYYDVVAGFHRPDGSAWQASVSVPRERYDALRVGDTIAIRYLAELPLLARTTDRSTASIAWGLARKVATIPLLVWLAAGFVALWIAARLGTIPSVVVGAGWIAAAFPMLFATPSPRTPGNAEATARVVGITNVRNSPARSTGRRAASRSRRRRLEVPYQVVQLAVPVEGGRDSVLAVDAVDSGSVAGLDHGARLPVKLDPGQPREARLAAGSRRFVDANRWHHLVPVVGCGVLGTLAALVYARARRRRRETGGDRAPVSRGDAGANAATRMGTDPPPQSTITSPGR